MMECSYVTTSVFYNNWTAGVTTVKSMLLIYEYTCIDVFAK